MGSRGANSAPPGADQARGLRRWWLDRPLRAKGLIVVAVPLIVLMGITAANLLLLQSESHERTESTNARNLAAAASLVLTDALNAETGVRGYLLTRQNRFLAPTHLAEADLPGELARVKALEKNNGMLKSIELTNTVQDDVIRKSGSAASRGATGGGGAQTPNSTNLMGYSGDFLFIARN